LSIGSDLPTDQNYDFQGVLDEVRVYNYGLSVPEIQQLAGLVTGIAPNSTVQIPTTIQLEQNYPNPFNPTTTIRFGIPNREVVSVRIFNLLGETVATLVDEAREPGFYSAVWDATNVPSGVYFCQLTSAREVFTRKLVLIR